MYKLTRTSVILRLTDGAYIPSDPSNADYQAYLKWVSEGNTASEADPVQTSLPADNK